MPLGFDKQLRLPFVDVDLLPIVEQETGTALTGLIEEHLLAGILVDGDESAGPDATHPTDANGWPTPRPSGRSLRARTRL